MKLGITNIIIRPVSTLSHLQGMAKWQKKFTNDEIFNKFTEKIQELKQQEELIVERSLTSKLNSLYNGTLPLKDTKHKFLNLSKYELSDTEKCVLNLGLNCHLLKKFDLIKKKMEIELLYQCLLDMSKEGKVTIKTELADDLRCESNKVRSNHNTKLLTPEQRQACYALKNNDKIIIREAEKSNICHFRPQRLQN